MEKKSAFVNAIKQLQEQAETAQILRELLDSYIDNDEDGRHIPRDEDKVKNLIEKLGERQKAQEDVHHHLKTVVAELVSAVNPHDYGESARPYPNDHDGDDQNVPAADEDQTAAGDHAGGKAPEIATSSPSSPSSGKEARDK